MTSASQDNAMPSGQFCGTTEVARMLGLSVGTVQSLVERQELHAWKTRGGHRRISLASVQEYQRRNHSTALGINGNDRIMWVQENGPQRQKLLQNLGRWGIKLQIDWFDNMVEALMGLQNLRPGLVVIDMKVPQAEALQFIRHVHSHSDFRALTLLTLSASRLPEDVLSPGLGARVHWARKPLDWSWLRGYCEAYQLLQQRQPMH
ncbi:MAG: helix-turn-helix domain-containing protein [Alphaproteobacteria bacterium]|nr:helix-turn-helix domain-containing protein [Alphaproteobacteria bacterium]